MNKLIVPTLSLILISATAFSEDMHHNHNMNHGTNSISYDATPHSQHNSTTPSEIMTTHGHSTGDIMFSYKYMHMEMDGLKSGTNEVTTQNILADYMVAPLNMQMDMHMFGAMYGINNRLTAMVMMPYLDKSMEHQRADGSRFNSNSDGFGDLKLSLMASLCSIKKLQGIVGISLPTGSIDKRNDSGDRLPYAMQLGSGTTDLNLGLTYTDDIANSNWSWGSQADATIRTGLNNNGYRLGNKYSVKGWVGRKINNSISAFTKVDATYNANITSVDSQLNPMMAPTANANNFGGSEIELGLGINYAPAKLAGHNLSIEFDVPVYQNLNGPQMATDYTAMFNWRKAF